MWEVSANEIQSGARVAIRDDGEPLSFRQMFELLEHESQTKDAQVLPLLTRETGDVEARDLDLSGIGSKDPRDQVEQCGLPAAARSRDHGPRTRGGDKPLQGYPPRGMAYWEVLHGILQEEDVLERDRFFMYWAHTLGIERGKPFKPTDAQKKALMAGEVSGEAVGKTLVFNERLEGVLRKDGWRYILSGKLPDAFEHTQRVRDFDMLDPRSRFTYEAITSSPRMGHPVVGKGQSYAGRFEDSKGNRLRGDQSYVMKFDPVPPVKLFWSVVFYDVESRTLIVNKTRNATIGSRATKNLQKNKDGSVYVFAGPKPPKGWESNWVETIPGRGWFPYVRLYAPGEKWFDEDAFTLPQIEKVDFAKYAK